MKTSRTIVAVMTAGCLAALLAGAPVAMQAQSDNPAPMGMGTATIHGKVTNPAGVPMADATVKLTRDSNPSSADATFDFSFPTDANGEYKGSVKPGTYTAVVFQGKNHVDYMPAKLGNGEDDAVNFDMTRKEYIDKMSPADRAALEEYKKKISSTTAANSKIANLNALLTQARTDIGSSNFDAAIKSMTDATATKPDEPILWDTLGDAQLGAANAAEKASKSDPSLADKYGAAITSYQKAVSLAKAAAKPNLGLAATAENQMGQAYGKTGKTKEATDAYDTAAKDDPTKAGMYYYNEAATLFNASAMDEAAAAAQKAITADPTKVDAYYIQGQALIQKATVDPKTNKIIAPPGCLEAYQKYLELAPTGPHAQEIKEIMAGMDTSVEKTYKAGKK